MARKQTFTVCLFSFLALILSIDGADVASSPASVDCNSVILNMADCLTFVQNGSTGAVPQKTCCDGLKIVVKQSPICLCEGFENSASYGIPLDMNKALTLPKACHIQTPPLSECNITVPGVTSSATSPVSSATPAPPSTRDNYSPIPATITDSSDSAPSKSLAAQIKAHPFTIVAIFVSAMVIHHNSI